MIEKHFVCVMVCERCNERIQGATVEIGDDDYAGIMFCSPRMAAIKKSVKQAARKAGWKHDTCPKCHKRQRRGGAP